MKTYFGTRIDGECEVYVKGDDGRQYPLALRLDIRNHSPTGFEWGYSGSGPSQLALAILADHFGPSAPPVRCPFCSAEMKNSGVCSEPDCSFNFAVDDDPWACIRGRVVHYMDFKEIICKLPKDKWEITSHQIDQWIKKNYESNNRSKPV